MCIRAFDYLPPVDVTFGDFLRAVVTADRELSPEDPTGQRAALIEAFRRRGIYASGVRSSAEESLLWDRVDRPMAAPSVCVSALTQHATGLSPHTARSGRRRSGPHLVARGEGAAGTTRARMPGPSAFLPNFQ